MDAVWNILKDTFLNVLGSLWHNFPVLVIGMLVAGAMQVYLNTDKMRAWLMRRSSVSIPVTVVLGAFTPLCACGTMAVVLGMMASALSWGAIMAFLTSSPLMSPEGFILISGIISPEFAIALTVSSVVIGLGSGFVAYMLQKKTGYLDNQLRFTGKEAQSTQGTCACASQPVSADRVRTALVSDDALDASCACTMKSEAPSACCAAISEAPSACCAAICEAPSACCAAISEASSACCAAISEAPSACCAAIPVDPGGTPVRLNALIRRLQIDKMARIILDIGIKKMLPLFATFAGIGYLINRFIPAEWIRAVFGTQNAIAVPLSAMIGLPLYINGDSSIPLIRSLLQSGVSPGAMLAFLITGPGTSAGVLAGIATIMKKKAIILYTASLLLGSILLGYLYDVVLALI